MALCTMMLVFRPLRSCLWAIQGKANTNKSNVKRKQNLGWLKPEVLKVVHAQRSTDTCHLLLIEASEVWP